MLQVHQRWVIRKPTHISGVKLKSEKSISRASLNTFCAADDWKTKQVLQHGWPNYGQRAASGLPNKFFSSTQFPTVDSSARALASVCHVNHIVSGPPVARQSHVRPSGRKVWPPVFYRKHVYFQFIQSYGVLFVECSAASGQNVNAAVQLLARHLASRATSKQEDRGSIKDLRETATNSEESKCCLKSWRLSEVAQCVMELTLCLRQRLK